MLTKKDCDGSLESQEEERKGRRGAMEVEKKRPPLHRHVPEQVLYLLSSFYVSNNLGQTGFCPFFFYTPSLGDFTGSHLLEVAFMHLRKEHWIRLMTSMKALVGAWEFGTPQYQMNVRLNTHPRISWGKNQQLQRALCFAVSVKILFHYLVFHAQVLSSSLRLYEFFS